MAKKAKTPETPAGRLSWFDKKTSKPLIDGYARTLESFVTTMADGKVEPKELETQEKRIIDLMKEVEPLLNDDLHGRVTKLLCELTAYDIMQMLFTLQASRPKTPFRG